MSYIMVDIEADGPIPGDYSMISFGAVIVEPSLSKTFYGKLKPISEKWAPEALKVSGFTREETLGFEDPKSVMERFFAWIGENSKDRPIFISDNNGFDWQFVNWYFHHFLGVLGTVHLGHPIKKFRSTAVVHSSAPLLGQSPMRCIILGRGQSL